MAYSFKRADSGTLPVFYAFRAKMFHTFVENVNPRELARYDEEYFAGLLQRGEGAVWLVYDAGDIPVACGAVCLYRLSPKPWCPSGRHAYINSMWTEPEHRHKGLAASIMTLCKEFALEKGVDYVALHATESGIPVYERVGFHRTVEMRMCLHPADCPAPGEIKTNSR